MWTDFGHVLVAAQAAAQLESSCQGLLERLAASQDAAEQASLNAQLAAVSTLQQSSELARRHYQALLARSQQLQAEASLQLADSRIASPAFPQVRLRAQTGRFCWSSRFLGLRVSGWLLPHFMSGSSAASSLKAKRRKF